MQIIVQQHNRRINGAWRSQESFHLKITELQQLSLLELGVVKWQGIPSSLNNVYLLQIALGQILRLINSGRLGGSGG